MMNVEETEKLIIDQKKELLPSKKDSIAGIIILIAAIVTIIAFIEKIDHVTFDNIISMLRDDFWPHLKSYFGFVIVLWISYCFTRRIFVFRKIDSLRVQQLKKLEGEITELKSTLKIYEITSQVRPSPGQVFNFTNNLGTPTPTTSGGIELEGDKKE
jgi:hypothetical protein